MLENTTYPAGTSLIVRLVPDMTTNLIVDSVRIFHGPSFEYQYIAMTPTGIPYEVLMKKNNIDGVCLSIDDYERSYELKVIDVLRPK